MTGPSGAVVEWVTYDVYGAPTVRDQSGAVAASSAIGNPFLFTGREWDGESGKYFYRARMYDPVGGRFLQRDPLGYVDGLGLYEYGSSRPAVNVDPHGTDDSKPPEVPKSVKEKYDSIRERMAEVTVILSEIKSDIKDEEASKKRAGKELGPIEEMDPEDDEELSENEKAQEKYDKEWQDLADKKNELIGRYPALADPHVGTFDDAPLPFFPSPFFPMPPPALPNPFFPWGDTLDPVMGRCRERARKIGRSLKDAFEKFRIKPPGLALPK